MITLNDITQFLGVNTAVDEDLFEALINSTQAMMESYCGRKFDDAEYTDEDEILGQKIYTSHYPIISVSGVTLDEVSTDDYTVYTNYVKLGDYVWYVGQDYTITYTAGYETIPYDLQQVCINEVVRLYKRRKNIDVSAISMQDGSITIMSDGMLPYSKMVLDKYTKRRLF
jgi:hypothetical protein